MATTPTFALPYPALSDAPNDPAAFQALALAAEAAAFAKPPSAEAWRTSNLSVATGTWVLAAWQADELTNGMTRSTARLIAPIAGRYLIGGAAQFTNTSAGGVRIAQIRKNSAGSQAGGTEIASVYSAPHADTTNPVTVPIPPKLITLAATDYIEMFVIQSSGGTLNLALGRAASWLSLLYEGAAV